MDMSIIDKMSHADLKKYVEFLLWHYRVVDGFWFLFVFDDFDQQAAEKRSMNGYGPRRVNWRHGIF
jgi:hypothetical protein